MSDRSQIKAMLKQANKLLVVVQLQLDSQFMHAGYAATAVKPILNGAVINTQKQALNKLFADEWKLAYTKSIFKEGECH